MGDCFCDFRKVHFLGEWALHEISYYSHKNTFLISLMIGIHLLNAYYDIYC